MILSKVLYSFKSPQRWYFCQRHPSFQIRREVRLFSTPTTFLILICRLGKLRTHSSIRIWARWQRRKGGFIGVLFVLVESTVWNTDYHSRTVTLHLRGGKGMEWKKKKKKYFKIILFFPLFGSLNRREWKDHSLVWEFKWREWNGMEHSFLPILSNPQIFIPPKIERNKREWI